LLDNPPAKFFGDAIFAYAKSKPTDPAVPEMLYHLVKLPKWSGVTAVSSSYSKKAYFELHKNYPKNSWTQKAVCYY
jgi:TolA-binding protein